MTLRNTATAWGLGARTLHWVVVLLIIAAWVAVDMHESYPRGSPERGAWMRLHFSLGLTVFLLFWLRLGWRLSGSAPVPLPMPRWQLRAAAVVQAMLYLLMVAMPLTGMLSVMLRGRPIPWFGLTEIPPLLDKNPALGETVEFIHHDVLWPLLLLLVLGHAGAALWHHFITRDDTLRRMTWPRD